MNDIPAVGERVVFVGDSTPFLQIGQGGTVVLVQPTGIVVQWDRDSNGQVTVSAQRPADLLRKWYPPVRRNWLLYNWDAWVSLWGDLDGLTIDESMPRSELEKIWPSTRAAEK